MQVERSSVIIISLLTYLCEIIFFPALLLQEQPVKWLRKLPCGFALNEVDAVGPGYAEKMGHVVQEKKFKWDEASEQRLVLSLRALGNDEGSAGIPPNQAISRYIKRQSFADTNVTENDIQKKLYQWAGRC